MQLTSRKQMKRVRLNGQKCWKNVEWVCHIRSICYWVCFFLAKLNLANLDHFLFCCRKAIADWSLIPPIMQVIVCEGVYVLILRRANSICLLIFDFWRELQSLTLFQGNSSGNEMLSPTSTLFLSSSYSQDSHDQSKINRVI